MKLHSNARKKNERTSDTFNVVTMTDPTRIKLWSTQRERDKAKLRVLRLARYLPTGTTTVYDG